MLIIKHKLLSPRADYFEDEQYVASYDGGSSNLVFANGKEYSISFGSRELVENLVFPKGSANIACIIDYHWEVVTNEALADKTRWTYSGETIYYKIGELEVVAHSETPLNSNSGVIVCNKKKCKVIRKFFSAELYENDHSIASIKSEIFSEESIFKIDLPLSDRVFITVLTAFVGRNRMSENVRKRTKSKC